MLFRSGHKELCVQLARELNTFVFDGKYLNPSFPYEADDTAKVLAEKAYSLNYGALSETFNDLDPEQLYKIAKQIHDGKSLYLYCCEGSYMPASDFESKLRDINFPVRLITVPGSNLKQALIQEEGSIALIISYSERDEGILKVARVLSDRSIPMFMVTGPTRSVVMKYVQDTIQVSYFEPYPKIASIGSRTAVMLVLDILYADLFAMDYEQNMALINDADERRKALLTKDHQG